MNLVSAALYLALVLVPSGDATGPVRVTLVPPTPPAAPAPTEEAGESSGPRIGERLPLVARVEAPAGYRLGRVEMAAATEEFVLRVETPPSPDEVRAAGGPVEIPLEIIPFQVGEISFPGVRVSWMAPDGTTGEARSGSWPVTVQATVENTAEATPADIRGPVDLRVPFPVRAALLAAAAVVLAAGLAWLLWWRRRVPEARQVAAPPDRFGGLSADEWALRALERLVAAGVLFREGTGAFHVRLAEIVRLYLDGRYGVETAERTTTEILAAVEQVARPLPGARGRLGDVLSRCDLVKFARWHPPDEQAVALAGTARRFVEETRPAPEADTARQAESA